MFPMSELKMEAFVLPPIPAKRYFTIGEVGDLCGVKPHVLRYWEQEFTQLKPVKRRGNRRYYQHHEVLLIRRIRELLYSQGFTINGARNKLSAPGGNSDGQVPAVKLRLNLFEIKDELMLVLSLLKPNSKSKKRFTDASLADFF